MGAATLRPGALRALLGEVDVVHYPLTVPYRGRTSRT